ncbi:MAG: glucose-1-phosphate adenylyltransferase subunit GlgD [Firmicutes bacterium HGW-Firmicutes-13]|nr:MAG: glucose-1-phosphate adenylyltransferase subunit GlgD [Firmicutes bacterium HGW-Firmicutes-13]
MKNVMGVINVNGRSGALKELTLSRCSASVPFGGRYRLIDFVLSSMVNSGVQNVAVFTVNKYRSLMDHLGYGKEWDLNRKKDGLFVLPPDINYHPGEPKGELQHLYNHLDYLYRSRQKYVIISGSNMVLNINYTAAFNFHREVKADITVLYREENTAGVEDFAKGRRLALADDGRVLDIEIKPGRLNTNKVLLKTFIMEKSLFIDLIESCVRRKRCSLIRDGIIRNIGKLNIFGFPHKGYFAVINSIGVYYKYSMDLLRPEVWQELFFRPGLIYTKVKDEPPTKYMEGAQVTNSLLANGCLIEGRVENSILFRGVKVHRGVFIKDSIIMQRSEVGENVRIENAILDKEVHICREKEISGERNNPVVIPKKMVI